MATTEDEVMEFEEAEEGLEELEDGSTIVTLSDEEQEAEVEENRSFYANLVSTFDESTLSSLGIELKEKIDRDKKSREKRDKEYADALKRTGLGDEAPGGASFPGASRVVHPILIEGCVDFAARAVSELMPPGGPVKEDLPGEITKERAEKAERIKNAMNWQFRKQMPEFYTELEQLLTQVPLGGVGYLRIVYDEDRKRPVPTFVPLDDVYLPYAATSFYTAERVTYAEPITQMEFERRVKNGMYRDVSMVPPSQIPEKTQAGKANDKIEGRDESTDNQDGLRIVYLIQCSVPLNDPLGQTEATGDEDRLEYRPYLISLDSESGHILAVIRNWEEDDEGFQSMYWMTEWPMIPWRGAYPIGLNQLMAGIPAAITGALRALMDSAHVNNLPTLIKLKGANFVGQSDQVNVTQITEIQGGISGGDDIRKLLMAVPYNPPSTVLFQLLGFLVEAGKGIVRTTFELPTDGQQNVPVGTVLALIEQGMKVMSAVHRRLWTAMERTILLLYRINRLYLTDEAIKDEAGLLLARRDDFTGPPDAVPTADPEVFSEVQRTAQMQMVVERATGNPLYDQRKVEELFLKRTKIPNATDLLVAAPKPQYMNAVNENAAMALGRPVAAFPEQDHLAHIQVLLDFMTSPLFGFNAIIAPRFLPAALQHLAEHLVFWYVNEFVAVASEVEPRVTDFMKVKDPKARQEMDRLMAEISADVVMPSVESQFQQLPQIIQMAQKMLAQFQPQGVQDPSMAIAQIQKEIEDKKAEVKREETQVKAQAAAQKSQTDIAKEQLKQDREDKREAAGQAFEMQKTQVEETGDTVRQEKELTVRERMNTSDNQTAMLIAAAEIESGDKSDLSTGTGINPNP